MQTICRFFQRLLNRVKSLTRFGRRMSQTSTNANLEVERKFRIRGQDIAVLDEKLLSGGFAAGPVVFMADTFLYATDDGEFLRLRRERQGDNEVFLLTHKTWVATAGGDRERKETEEEISGFAAGSFLELAGRSGGAELLSFSKNRRIYRRRLEDHAVVVAIDRVEGLGRFSGPYMEIEIIVPVGTDPQAARAEINTLAARLLGDSLELVGMSYLDMLRASLKED